MSGWRVRDDADDGNRESDFGSQTDQRKFGSVTGVRSSLSLRPRRTKNLECLGTIVIIRVFWYINTENIAVTYARGGYEIVYWTLGGRRRGGGKSGAAECGRVDAAL